eukprot:TRINITY_DN458_c0_g1_i2.p1 TRINITY_DN458_c0_g1~~TRINITY_DN458_c0_g1_i2.p1  ORF type:complete len:146 (+),score=19.99 TRINITY_DN458_c0_g1_i2:327-764(+)
MFAGVGCHACCTARCALTSRRRPSRQQAISTCFSGHIAEFRTVYSEFCSKQGRTPKILAKVKQNPKFAEFLEIAHDINIKMTEVETLHLLHKMEPNIIWNSNFPVYDLVASGWRWQLRVGVPPDRGSVSVHLHVGVPPCGVWMDV